MCEVMIFVRAKPDEVVALYPKGHPDMPDGGEVTRLQELRLRLNILHRDDIALVNLPDGSQELLFPTKDGKTSRGYIWRLMTKAQKKEAMRINRELVALAVKYPEFKVYLRHG